MTQEVRIWVDFMKADDHGRLVLTTRGTLDDLARHGIELREGQRLSVYTDDADDTGARDDLLADGIVHRDEKNERWVLEIDWRAIGNASSP